MNKKKGKKTVVVAPLKLSDDFDEDEAHLPVVTSPANSPKASLTKTNPIGIITTLPELHIKREIQHIPASQISIESQGQEITSKFIQREKEIVDQVIETETKSQIKSQIISQINSQINSFQSQIKNQVKEFKSQANLLESQYKSQFKSEIGSEVISEIKAEDEEMGSDIVITMNTNIKTSKKATKGKGKKPKVVAINIDTKEKEFPVCSTEILNTLQASEPTERSQVSAVFAQEQYLPIAEISTLPPEQQKQFSPRVPQQGLEARQQPTLASNSQQIIRKEAPQQWSQMEKFEELIQQPLSQEKKEQIAPKLLQDQVQLVSQLKSSFEENVIVMNRPSFVTTKVKPVKKQKPKIIKNVPIFTQAKVPQSEQFSVPSTEVKQIYSKGLAQHSAQDSGLTQDIGLNLSGVVSEVGPREQSQSWEGSSGMSRRSKQFLSEIIGLIRKSRDEQIIALKERAGRLEHAIKEYLEIAGKRAVYMREPSQYDDILDQHVALNEQVLGAGQE